MYYATSDILWGDSENKAVQKLRVSLCQAKGKSSIHGLAPGSILNPKVFKLTPSVHQKIASRRFSRALLCTFDQITLSFIVHFCFNKSRPFY